MFAVCKWLGNSPTVAKQHYLHLTDLDFDWATGIDQPASRGKMRATAGQKAGQQGAARRRITTHLELAQKEFNVDPQRTYLMGHPMGGSGTWYLGMKYPEK